jgi:hypothetical protein
MDSGARIDTEWLSCAVRALRAGRPLSREVIALCYRSSRKHPESEKVSEKWIDFLWERCANIPVEEFLAVRWWAPKRRSALLHRILT